MERIDWQNLPEPSICPHSIQSYGFNRFLDSIRSWSPSNSALRCQECEKEEMVNSSRKTKKVTLSFRAKFLWVCLECDRIFCGAENLGPPDSHIRSHAIKNNHLFAIPIAAWCLACKSIQWITTMETIKELCSTIKIKKGLGGVQQGDFDNLPCDYAVIPLQNLGNICFFNAILQNLLSMRVLRAKFRQLDCEPESVTHDLRDLFLDTDDILEDDVDHTDLFDSICGREPSFLGHQEHDSHELLRQLLTLLLADGTSFIQDVFGGKLSSTVSCVQCGNASKSYERFLDLSLAIPSNECLTKNDEVSAPRDPVPSSMEISSYPSRDNSSLQEQCLSEETHIVPADTENVDLSSQFSDMNPNVSSRKRLRLEGQAQSGNNNGDPLSIEKCLDLFIAPEIVCGEYVCDHCSNRSQDRLQTELQSTSKIEKLKEGERLGGHEVMDEVKTKVESKEGVDVGSRKAEMKASKGYLIFKAPLVLTIHLKRLTRDTNGIIKKIDSHVNIQELLDLTPYMDPSCEHKEKPNYRLIGMVEHVGARLRGGQSKGHYVAYVRGVRRKRHELAWFRASDDVVQEVSLNKVLDSEAYILFYERMRS